MTKIVEAKNIVRTYHNGQIDVQVLKGISIDIEDKDFLIITGKSGAGKSTLLYQLALLDNPNSGEVFIEGKEMLALSSQERSKFRLNELGYVFQDYALMPELNALENVILPLMMQGLEDSVIKEKGMKALKSVGLGDKCKNLPSQLSGGEKQRVGVARAIVNEPTILFADEPTANLDSENSKIVMDLLKDLNEKGQTVVLITHEPEFYGYAKRVIYMSDGEIVKEKLN